MHGGNRNKLVQLWGYSINIGALRVLCDGTHAHAPWGLIKQGPATVFATAEERRYPELFCARLAALAAERHLQPSQVGDAKSAIQRQARRGQNLAVSEYKAVAEVSTDLPLQAYLQREGITDLASVKVLDGVDKSGLEVHGSKTFRVGYFWNKFEFLEQAKNVVHPFDRTISVSGHVAKTWRAMAAIDPTELIKLRSDGLRHYEVRAKHLNNMERDLHSSMPKHVERVVKNKRILLFKEILRDINYDDQQVADLLIHGVRVVGCPESLSIWPKADNGPVCTVADVEAFSGAARAKLKEHTARGNIVQEVWRQTSEEVESGLLEGPFTAEQLNVILGDKWTGARRFGIQQSEKVRVTDDFSEFQINT